MIITIEALKAIAPQSKRTNYKNLAGLALWMNYWFPLYDIDTKEEMCHFLCQAAHETDSFNSLIEYASGSAYDTRTDLGNTPAKDGDGARLKGRGIYMITGTKNYKTATLEWNEMHPDDKQDFFEKPELLQEPRFAVWSACQYWDTRDFNSIAALPDTAKIWSKKLNRNLTPLQYITFRINGGFNGYLDREKFYVRAKSTL